MGVAVPAFTPTSISGLQLWLDASDSSTLYQNSNGTTAATADGDPVGYWADKSGNGRHATQSDGTKKAALKVSNQNGRNVNYFDGVNDNLGFSFPISYGYVWVVYKFTGVTNSASAALINRSLGPGLYATMNFDTKPGIYWYKAGAGSDETMSLSVGTGTSSANVVRFILLQNEMGISLNETTKSTVSLASSPVGNWINIGSALTAQAYQGSICEIVVSTNAATDSDFTNMYLYLKQKWGTT